MRKIAELEEQLRVIRGQDKCPSCGKIVPAGVKFCPNCGGKIEQPAAAEQPAAEQPAAQNACARCGQPLEEGAAFCTSCGTKVE